MAEPLITIRYDQQKLTLFERVLSGIPGAMPRAVSQGINRTLISARANMAREVKTEVPRLSIGGIKSALRLDKATFQRWVGRVLLSYHPISLRYFSYRQTQEGVPFMVLRSRGRLMARRAFQMLRREKGTSPSEAGPNPSIQGKSAFMRGLAGGGKPVLDWRTGEIPGGQGKLVPRLPIFKLFGPALTDLYKDMPQIVQQVEKYALGSLEQHIEDQVKRQLAMVPR